MKKLFILNLILFIGFGLCSCNREIENIANKKIEKKLYGSWEYSNEKNIKERNISFQKDGKFSGYALWVNCDDKKNIWNGTYELIEDEFKNPMLKLKYRIDGAKIKEESVPIQLDGKKLKFGNYDYRRNFR
jgi:hypothetical protein